MTFLKIIPRSKYFFKWNDLSLITGIDRAENFYVKNMGLYVSIGRHNVSEERSYSNLIYPQIAKRAKARLKHAVIFNSLNIVLVSYNSML